MSTLNTIESITEDVLTAARRTLSAQRYAHVCSVADLATTLARRFGVSVRKVALAAVAHDLDRERTPAQLIARCGDWNAAVLEVERSTPILLHGPVAAERLARCYAVTDPVVLAAVRHHTLGSPLLAEPVHAPGLLLYAADFCEPLRSWPSEATRNGILRLDSLPEMVAQIIRVGEERWGTVEEPTAQMYARLLETH